MRCAPLRRMALSQHCVLAANEMWGLKSSCVPKAEPAVEENVNGSCRGFVVMLV